MKTLLMLIMSTLMLSPAMAFDQTDLDNLESYDQLYDFEEINMDGITARNGGDAIDSFLARRKFRCIAENGRGARYKAEGPNKQRVRRRAMRKCRRDSFRPRSCRIIRCKRRGGKFGQFLDLIDLIDEITD